MGGWGRGGGGGGGGGGVNFIRPLGTRDPINHRVGSIVQGWVVFLKKAGLVLFLTNFFKAIIFTIILPLRLRLMFGHKFVFFFLQNATEESHSK